MIQFTFTTDSAADAARVLEALNDAGVAVSRPTGRRAPAERAAEVADDTPGDDDAPTDDPWAEDGSTRAAAPRTDQRSASEGDHKPPSGVPRTGTVTVTTPQGDRDWTFGKEGAPMCECATPYVAAFVQPTDEPEKWQRWSCALKFSKDTYKEACDFSEFASKKKGGRK